MENSTFNKIINFIKNTNENNITVQSFKYNKNKETILFLIDQVNMLCYDNKFKNIAIKLYDILTAFLNKTIDQESIDTYFEKLYYQELDNLLT